MAIVCLISWQPVAPARKRRGERGVGDGTFAAAVGITMPWACRKVALIDWNADGNTDLLAASAQTAEIALLLGDGTGNFPLYPGGRQPVAPADFVVADLNADALPDLAAYGRCSVEHRRRSATMASVASCRR